MIIVYIKTIVNTHTHTHTKTKQKTILSVLGTVNMTFPKHIIHLATTLKKENCITIEKIHCIMLFIIFSTKLCKNMIGNLSFSGMDINRWLEGIAKLTFNFNFNFNLVES